MNAGLDKWVLSCIMDELARRANHSIEMMSWIKAQAEMPALYPALLF